MLFLAHLLKLGALSVLFNGVYQRRQKIKADDILQIMQIEYYKILKSD